MIVHVSRTAIGPDSREVEIVERKGLGHPDTLADLIADEFSARYSRLCLERFGQIANHTVDKVVLLGGTAQLDFGCHSILTPITAWLIGKVSQAVGNQVIPVEDLFIQSVNRVMTTVFGSEIITSLESRVTVHDGIGKDHLPGFYRPGSVADIVLSNAPVNANDTAYCCGYAPLSMTERVAVGLENHVCSKEFKSRYPSTGWDVKVMAVRSGRCLRLTCCIPFIASLTPSRAAYQDALDEIHAELLELANSLGAEQSLQVSLDLNTRDDRGRFAYLTVFGTALDKGDQGVVGRGNRFSGTISSSRPTSIEAPYGKNPVRHAGKLYSLAAEEISWRVSGAAKDANVETVIACRNGDHIASPEFTWVAVDPNSGLEDEEIRRIAHDSLEAIQGWTKHYVGVDPVERHRLQGGRPHYLLHRGNL